jgi:diadenylate cyclase
MQEFFTSLGARIELLASRIGIWDFIDIVIIAFVIYKALGFIKETRAEQLVKGLLVLVVATVLSGLLHLYAINWILRGVMNFGIIALLIVFQPELRRALERVGRSNILHPQFPTMDKDDVKSSAAAIVHAVSEFQTNKVGALIILERKVPLNDFVESGTVINSDITEQLLQNLFYVGSPLHDGAVIIRGNKIYAAGVVLPLTRNRSLPKELGTRHRAGIGVTEVSDAFAIIVSEESGIISKAIDGILTRFLDLKDLEKDILNLYFGEFSKEKPKPWTLLARRVFGRDKDADK